MVATRVTSTSARRFPCGGGSTAASGGSRTKPSAPTSASSPACKGWSDTVEAR